MLETRSRLYRALTRAHMLVVVVNESVRGGWLEHLNNVRLQRDKKFDREAEIERQRAGAAEQMVEERVREIDAALRAASEHAQLSEAESRAVHKRIDVLVHNGRYIGPGHMDRLLDTPIELIEKHLQANVIS